MFSFNLLKLPAYTKKSLLKEKILYGKADICLVKKQRIHDTLLL